MHRDLFLLPDLLLVLDRLLQSHTDGFTVLGRLSEIVDTLTCDAKGELLGVGLRERRSLDSEYVRGKVGIGHGVGSTAQDCGDGDRVLGLRVDEEDRDSGQLGQTCIHTPVTGGGGGG